MVVIRGRLSPEVGAVLRRTLDAATERLREEGRDSTAADATEITAEQRRADALGLIAESALAGDLDRGTAADRYQVVVHVDEGVLGRDDQFGQSVVEDGAHISAETSRRLACDAATLTMRHGASGQILDIGRKTRTISPALRRALTTRDRHCRFPGCSAGHCDAHHVRHWANGGPTKLDNLVLLCRRHHRAVHEEGFTVRVGATGEAAFVRPDKQPLPNLPALPRWQGGALAPTLGRLPGDGIAISPHTAMPHWHGERLDEGWAVSVLWRPRESVPTG